MFRIRTAVHEGGDKTGSLLGDGRYSCQAVELVGAEVPRKIHDHLQSSVLQRLQTLLVGIGTDIPNRNGIINDRCYDLLIDRQFIFYR